MGTTPFIVQRVCLKKMPTVAGEITSSINYERVFTNRYTQIKEVSLNCPRSSLTSHLFPQ